MQTEYALTNQKQLKRTIRQVNGTLTANAGASAVLSLDVPSGQLCYVEALVKMSAGGVVGPRSVTATNADELLTFAAAHEIETGTPVQVGGTVVPTGITAGTVYYAYASSATAITLYDTKANAVLGGATGKVAFTTDGTAVTVSLTVEQAFYRVQAVARNRGGVVALLGSQDLVALEDVAAWACAFVANNTDDTVELQLTPDATLDTKYEVFAEFFTDSISA